MCCTRQRYATLAIGKRALNISKAALRDAIGRSRVDDPIDPNDSARIVTSLHKNGTGSRPEFDAERSMRPVSLDHIHRGTSIPRSRISTSLREMRPNLRRTPTTSSASTSDPTRSVHGSKRSRPAGATTRTTGEIRRCATSRPTTTSATWTGSCCSGCSRRSGRSATSRSAPVGARRWCSTRGTLWDPTRVHIHRALSRPSALAPAPERPRLGRGRRAAGPGVDRSLFRSPRAGRHPVHRFESRQQGRQRRERALLRCAAARTRRACGCTSTTSGTRSNIPGVDRGRALVERGVSVPCTAAREPTLAGRAVVRLPEQQHHELVERRLPPAARQDGLSSGWSGHDEVRYIALVTHGDVPFAVASPPRRPRRARDRPLSRHNTRHASAGGDRRVAGAYTRRSEGFVARGLGRHTDDLEPCFGSTKSWLCSRLDDEVVAVAGTRPCALRPRCDRNRVPGSCRPTSVAGYARPAGCPSAPSSRSMRTVPVGAGNRSSPTRSILRSRARRSRPCVARRISAAMAWGAPIVTDETTRAVGACRRRSRRRRRRRRVLRCRGAARRRATRRPFELARPAFLRNALRPS